MSLNKCCMNQSFAINKHEFVHVLIRETHCTPRRFILRRAEVTVALPRRLTPCMATCKTHVPQAVSQYWMLHQWYLVAPGSHWSRLPLVKNASENTQAVRTPTEHSDQQTH